MARARNLKPGFFTNDRLGELEPLARLLFQGLWCHADREGRLENRPKKLKAEILPYDDCDIPNLLLQLAAAEFIICYQADGSQYIQIINFLKHQNPHPREPASLIPAVESREKPRQEIARQDPAVEKPEPARPLPSSLLSSSPIPHPESSEAIASARKPMRPIDLDKAYWETGKAYLEANGVLPQRSGGLLGRWRREYGREAVVAALARAEAESPSEAVAFIEGCLRSSNGKRFGPATGIAAGFADALQARARERH